MKVAIGMNVRKSSFGGGNQFGNALLNFLNKHDVEVTSELKDDDIDIILMTEPRTWLDSSSFGPIEISTYLRKINPNALVIQRINECDERKGTKTVNKILSTANTVVDHTVYIASWLKPLFEAQGLKFTKEHSIIFNGADNTVFFRVPHELEENSPVKIVTHHWSPHRLKGWDVYEKIDQLISDKTLGNVEFHYIGTPPRPNKNQNIIFHSPTSGKDLATKLQSCHIYLTASINEPAGMHHVEGGCCGLPIVYRSSGALPEYCSGYGAMFKGTEDVENAIKEVINNYETYLEKMKDYNKTSEKMCSEYLSLFQELLSKKDEILNNRKRIPSPIELKMKIFTQRAKKKLLER